MLMLINNNSNIFLIFGGVCLGVYVRTKLTVLLEYIVGRAHFHQVLLRVARPFDSDRRVIHPVRQQLAFKQRPVLNSL